MKIYYVTGNDGKIELAKRILKDVEIIKEDIETPEIQSIDCKEVANYSSKYAANKLNKPVLKNDSGLFINSLNGFPGALSKYAEDTITADGYIKLLKGVKDRSCYWLEVLSYCNPGCDPVSFTSITKGTISEEVRNGRGYDFDKIFIPLGDTRTFSEMSFLEQLDCFNKDAYLKLYEYLKKN